MRVLVATLLASVAGGCSALPPIDAGVCGNRVLDITEDCDTFSEHGGATECGAPDTANACHFICDATGDLECPDGWRCGLDGRCRRPLGRFSSEPQVFSFPVDHFEIGDVDGDRNLDLIGSTQSTVSVRFGARGGDLDELLRVGIHRAQDTPDIADVDQDGSLDVVVPVSTGLSVLRGRPERRLAPVAYSPFDLPDFAEVRLIPFESERRDLGTELLSVAGTRMFIEDPMRSVLMPLGKSVSDVLGRIPIADLDRTADRRAELALTFDQAASVWVYTSTPTRGGDLQVVLRQEVRLPGPAVSGSLFADINGDGFLDLITEVRSGMSTALAVAHGDPRRPGRFVDLSCMFQLEVAGASMPMPLAMGDINGDRRADFVLPRRVALNTLGSTPACGEVETPQIPVAPATRGEWSEATISDFNRDGSADIAAVVADTPDIDVLIGTGVGLFNTFNIRTSAPPIMPRAGDFDGDLVGDLAFSQAGGEVEEDELFVSFGAVEGGPSAPISMGRLGVIEHIEPLTMVTDADTLDGITDLLVTSSAFGDSDQHSAAILFGNSERRLLAPFFLEENGRLDVPLAAVAGNFCRECPGGGDCADATDVVSVTRMRSPLGQVGGRTRAWIVPGDPDGGPAALSAELAVAGDYPGVTGFDVACASYLAGDLDGDGYDELIGYDGRKGCRGSMLSRPSQLTLSRLALPSTRCGGDTQTTMLPLSGSFNGAVDGHMIDLDADGDKDVVIAFSGNPLLARTGADNIGSGAFVLWNDDGQLSTDAITTISVREPVQAVGAIQVDADEVPELLLLTTLVGRDGSRRQGLYQARLDEGRRSYRPVELITDQAGGEDLAVGDLDGDGIDDIAWAGDEVVKVLYAVSGGREGSL